MHDSETDTFRKALEKLRNELTHQHETSAPARAPVRLDQQSVGRVSRVEALQQQAMAQAHERKRAGELVRIDRALGRIESGEFGVCTRCEMPIAPKRLAIDPAAALCIGCASGT